VLSLLLWLRLRLVVGPASPMWEVRPVSHVARARTGPGLLVVALALRLESGGVAPRLLLMLLWLLWLVVGTVMQALLVFAQLAHADGRFRIQP
jgi:hypothetical protein